MFGILTNKAKGFLSKGFWNDRDGFSIADFVIICILPIWMFVAVKLALSGQIAREHVDFFTVLSYPLLIAVGGKAIGSITLPFSDRVGVKQIDSQPYCDTDKRLEI